MKRNKFIRFALLFFILILILATAGTFAFNKLKNHEPICEKCNVVLISIDTLSALHLPCYGYERNTAPNLCKFADKNLNFLNSYSQSPITMDSHFSIFTSLYPSTHKMTRTIVEDNLSEKFITLAQLFRINGYKTYYYGPLTDMNMPINRGIERGFDFFEKEYLQYSNEKNWGSVYQKLTENISQKKPSFFFLHTYATHNPYLTGHMKKHLFTDLPEYPNIPLTQDEQENFPLSQDFISFCANYISESSKLYKETVLRLKDNSIQQIIEKLKNAKSLQEGISAFNTFDSKLKRRYFAAWHRSRITESDPNQIEYIEALYDEQIYNMDKRLGEFLKLMNDPKLSKNTIIIITSDHGEEFMEHGNLYHGDNVFRTSTQVPLIIHVPGVGSKKITELTQGIDIYPTIANLTNLVPQSILEGIDLTGMIMGTKDAKTNSYIKSEFRTNVVIQKNNLRFYYNRSNGNKIPIGLYDITKDPQEKNNIMSNNLTIINQFKEIIK